MPYTMETKPEAIKDLPKHAQEIWIAAFNSANADKQDEQACMKIAWAAVKDKYEQDEKGQWTAKPAEPAAGTKSVSLDEQARQTRDAYEKQFPEQAPTGAVPVADSNGWVREVYDDHIILDKNGDLYSIRYARDEQAQIRFVPESEWVKVEQVYVNAVKAISKTDDQLVVGNYLVLFGGRDLTGIGHVNATARRLGDPNLMKKNLDGSIGEWFSKDVALDSPYTFKGAVDVDWEHGGEELGPDAVLGYADLKSMTRDDKGVFVKRVLDRRNQYVQWLEELIDAGLVGSSAEATDAGVERKATGEITKWPLRRDTLTVMPFEPRMLTQNQVRACKALKIALPAAGAEGTAPSGRPAPPAQSQNLNSNPTPNGGPNMDEKEIKALQDRIAALETEPLTVEQRKSLKTIAERFGVLETEHAAMKKALEAEPARGANVAVNPGQKYPYKSFVKDAKGILRDASGYGEFLQDVAMAMSGTLSVAPRLASWADMNQKAMKAALGLNASTPSEGGYFVQTDHSAELVRMMIEEDDILARVRKLPLGANSDSITLNGIDETSRASTIWGGIVAYWKSEAVAPTASKPKFREIKLEAKGLMALYYATDKLLKLAPALGLEVRAGFREAMTFKVKDALINGTGAGKPLGLLQSGSIVSVTKETNQVADTIVHENVSKMKSRMLPASFAKSIWLANPDCQSQLDLLAFTIGAGGVLSPYVKYDDNGVMRIHGRPVNFTEHMQTLGDTGDFALWDPSSYYMIDLGEIEEASSIHVAFTTWDTCFRFAYYCDGQPMLASALTPAHGSNTLSTHVKIDARA